MNMSFTFWIWVCSPLTVRFESLLRNCPIYRSTTCMVQEFRNQLNLPTSKSSRTNQRLWRVNFLKKTDRRMEITQNSNFFSHFIFFPFIFSSNTFFLLGFGSSPLLPLLVNWDMFNRLTCTVRNVCSRFAKIKTNSLEAQHTLTSCIQNIYLHFIHKPPSQSSKRPPSSFSDKILDLQIWIKRLTRGKSYLISLQHALQKSGTDHTTSYLCPTFLTTVIPGSKKHISNTTTQLCVEYCLSKSSSIVVGSVQYNSI